MFYGRVPNAPCTGTLLLISLFLLLIKGWVSFGDRGQGALTAPCPSTSVDGSVRVRCLTLLGRLQEEHLAGTELYPDQCISTHISTMSFETLHFQEQTLMVSFGFLLWTESHQHLLLSKDGSSWQFPSLLLVKPALRWGCACSCPLCCPSALLCVQCLSQPSLSPIPEH